MFVVWGGEALGRGVIYHWTNAALWGVLVEVWGGCWGLSARMVLLLKWNNISLKAYAPRPALDPYIKHRSVWWILSRPINLTPVPPSHPHPHLTAPTYQSFLHSSLLSFTVAHSTTPTPPLALGCCLIEFYVPSFVCPSRHSLIPSCSLLPVSIIKQYTSILNSICKFFFFIYQLQSFTTFKLYLPFCSIFICPSPTMFSNFILLSFSSYVFLYN